MATDTAGDAVFAAEPGLVASVVALRAIWAEVLDVDADEIEETDNFFDIGGDSMLALETATLCRQAGMGIPLSGVLRCPVLVDLARVVAGTADVAATDALGSEFSDGPQG